MKSNSKNSWLLQRNATWCYSKLSIFDYIGIEDKYIENICNYLDEGIAFIVSPGTTDGEWLWPGDCLSIVTKQVKKYRNGLKIRDSERFADFGSLLGFLFSCFDNSIIV